jgi:PKD repeat protein
MRKIFERSAVLPLTAFVLSWSAVTVLFCGCGDADLIPKVTRIYVSDSCGMAPLDVGFVAYVSGGNQFDEPTGANSRLAVSWDFGDGYSAAGSQVFHTYAGPGRYTVLITVADRDGDTTAETVNVNVLADSLRISAASVPPPQSFVFGGRDSIAMQVEVESCDFRGGGAQVPTGMIFLWRTGARSVSTEPVAKLVFSSADTGWHDVFVTVMNPAASVTRHDTLSFFVIPPPTLWLILEVDMSEAPLRLDREMFVEGNFNGWDASLSPMTRLSEGQIWRTVVEVGRGSNQLFRFVDGLQAGGAEIVPDACSSQGMYRTVAIENEDVVYRAAFGACPIILGESRDGVPVAPNPPTR